jgi:hypothetical protein
VYAYAQKPAEAASPQGDYRFQDLIACSNPACASASTYQDYLACAEVACTDLASFCAQ